MFLQFSTTKLAKVRFFQDRQQIMTDIYGIRQSIFHIF